MRNRQKIFFITATMISLAFFNHIACDELTELEDTYRFHMREIQKQYCVETAKKYNQLDCLELKAQLQKFAAELKITHACKNQSPEDTEKHRQLLINRIEILLKWLSEAL